MSLVVIGTRGSPLALWQSNHVRDALMASRSDLEVRLEIIRTVGDDNLRTPLHAILDKGLFTRQIEEALLARTVDLAVHSLKDLPTELPDGLSVAAISARQDPADVLVATGSGTLETLSRGAEVLTGSLRRRAQLLHARPDLRVSSVRGNVGTRLRKLDESGASAIVLAGAGLVRLGLDGRITERLDPVAFLPACGQGALAVEIRSDDSRVRELLRVIDNAESRHAVTAERAFLGALGGGCQVPIGAYAVKSGPDSAFTLTGMVANLDGSRLLRAELTSTVDGMDAAGRLGRDLAAKLIADGCREILDEAMDQSQSLENR